MEKLTIVVIPNKSSQIKQYQVPKFLFKLLIAGSFVLAGVLGFLSFDYLQLLEMKKNHYKIISENQHLKGEAQLLVSNLENVKKSLQRVQDYTKKLSELVNLKVGRISQKTGIGPLSEEDYATMQKNNSEDLEASKSGDDDRDNLTLPLGIGINNLTFRVALDEMSTLEKHSQSQAIKLQRLLSTLIQKRSLLSSIPSVSPVRGWITSAYGTRTSPFTGVRAMHNGLDIAAAIGTPIYSPADGVVIFSGKKPGFGNAIMIAHHGSGVVTTYGHNAENMVREGQIVKRGDQIASVGNEGRTTGPHLHYEVYVNGRTADPKNFILNTDMNTF